MVVIKRVFVFFLLQIALLGGLNATKVGVDSQGPPAAGSSGQKTVFSPEQVAALYQKLVTEQIMAFQKSTTEEIFNNPQTTTLENKFADCPKGIKEALKVEETKEIVKNNILQALAGKILESQQSVSAKATPDMFGKVKQLDSSYRYRVCAYMFVLCGKVCARQPWRKWWSFPTSEKIMKKFEEMFSMEEKLKIYAEIAQLQEEMQNEQEKLLQQLQEQFKGQEAALVAFENSPQVIRASFRSWRNWIIEWGLCGGLLLFTRFYLMFGFVNQSVLGIVNFSWQDAGVNLAELSLILFLSSVLSDCLRQCKATEGPGKEKQKIS